MQSARIIQLFPDRLIPAIIDRDEHLANARTVLRNAQRHDDDTLRDACRVLQAWGGQLDWIEADAMMLAIATQNRPTADDYRAEAVPVLTFFAAFALFMALFFSVTP